MDLDFGVTGAGPAERKERTGAGMLRAEKKKVELPLGLSRRVCCADRSFAWCFLCCESAAYLWRY